MMNLAASGGLGGIDCPLPSLPVPCPPLPSLPMPYPPNDYHHVAAAGEVLAGRFLEDLHYLVNFQLGPRPKIA